MIIKLLLTLICCINIECKTKKINTNAAKISSKNAYSPNIKQTDPKGILTQFFKSEQILQGSFLHIISNEPILPKSAEPNLATNGRDLSGTFAINLKKPVSFKWKYLFPYVKQIVKDDKHLLYKDGQSIKKSTDGVIVKEVNTKKPYIIFQSLPITFLFDVPVETWINDIEILDQKENHNYISMTISYKTLKSKGILKHLQTEKVNLIFAKYPVCLLQWYFTDQNGQHNQLTLFNISINKKLKPNALQMD